MKTIGVIGGGISGMETSAYLTSFGYKVKLFEKSDKLGGHLLKWHKLFPTKRKGVEVLEYVKQGLNENVEILLDAKIIHIEKSFSKFIIILEDKQSYEVDAIVITTGFDLFDATKKEEYGYGIYDNVITSAELEEMFCKNEGLFNPAGKIPKRIGFVHCVGSRDEKVGNIHCSKLCCVTAVKQAVEIKNRLPESEIFCFYMDMRMYGRHFEEIFKESQEKWSVNYIRGRLSEACENIDGSITVKVEDTLVNRPMKMNVDLLVLLVGYVPSKGTTEIGKMLNLKFSEDGFLKNADHHTLLNVASVPGVFMAGTSVGPRTITNSIVDARSTAAQVYAYLEKHNISERATQNGYAKAEISKSNN